MPTFETLTLLRVMINESDRCGHHPLHEAIVMKARDLGLAGATVLRGPMGFGTSHRIHTSKILDLSFDLPVVIEIVDTAENIHGFINTLEGMMTGALITLEEVKAARLQPPG